MYLIFFINIAPNRCSSNNLWTTYSNCKDLLKGKGYSKGFTELNKNTQITHPDKINLAYIANIYYPVDKHNYDIPEDQYALYNLLNFLLKSGLYYGKHITIYIPSKRMRKLLQEWIDAN